MHSRLARDRYFNDFFRYISNSGQFSKTRQFIQHGDTSVYSHCVAVAYVSLWFSYRLHLSVSKQSLLMGAFLHDYFLYDWHENDPSHRLHGFTHPKRALINATADWNLSDRTQNIILRHMFPLTPVPPACRPFSYSHLKKDNFPHIFSTNASGKPCPGSDRYYLSAS